MCGISNVFVTTDLCWPCPVVFCVPQCSCIVTDVSLHSSLEFLARLDRLIYKPVLSTGPIKNVTAQLGQFIVIIANLSTNIYPISL